MTQIKSMFTTTDERMRQLLEIEGTVTHLTSILDVLFWDQRTYMPPRGIDGRSKAMAALEGTCHEKFTNPKIGELLSNLENDPSDLSLYDMALVREMRRDYDRQTKLPNEFVIRRAEITSMAGAAWEQARERNDFSLFAPYLEKIIPMKIEEADYVGYEVSPYNALLDEYEPGMTVDKLDHVLGNLRQSTIELLKKISASGYRPRTDFLNRKYDPELQIQLAHRIAERIGYDFSAGHLTRSRHPFTVNPNPGDVRITTRTYENFLSACIFSTIHESGHGMHHQGASMELLGTRLIHSPSYGIGESQSRLWENYIGRSGVFWEFWLPELQKVFPDQLKDVTPEEFTHGVNAVKPSLIRTEADEITYNLHVILRHEIERDLIEGNLSVNDIPRVWNKKMREYLGITPENNRDGCLQDIHWSRGAFGYFATYSLGNLYAAQIYAVLKKDHPDLEERVAKGEFAFIKQWLTDKIYQHGKVYTSDELITRVTGEPLNPRHFVEYATNKFGKIYGFQ